MNKWHIMKFAEQYFPKLIHILSSSAYQFNEFNKWFSKPLFRTDTLQGIVYNTILSILLKIL